MDLGLGIAMAAVAFSASGMVFTILTIKQSTSRDTIDAIETEMRTVQQALVDCRASVVRLHADNERLRTENERLMRRVLNLENGR